MQEMLLTITSLESLTEAMRKAGLNSTNVIFGRDCSLPGDRPRVQASTTRPVTSTRERTPSVAAPSIPSILLSRTPTNRYCPSIPPNTECLGYLYPG